MSEWLPAQVVRAPGNSPIAALDGFAALNQIVDAAKECITTHAFESTKQSRIQAYEHTEVARIKAAERTLKRYFGQVFVERHETFEALFSRLDRALDEGNGDAMSAVLQGIVDIAKSSPLAELGDLGQIRAALGDPNYVFDL